MKRILIFVVNVMLAMQVFAGGLLTNANQSAQFVRLLSRNASTDLDAVYFNPAGLTQLKDGIYFGIHNQSIIQTRNITTGPSFMYTDYKGESTIPFFPSAFAVYKQNKWAFSLGFGQNGGDGKVIFDKGFPSFEKVFREKMAPLMPALAELSALGFPVSDYGVDISFKSSSVLWGIQAGASYNISKVLSLFLGGRYVPVLNTYYGTISNIRIGPTDGLQNAQEYLTNAALAADAVNQSLLAVQLRLYSTKLADQILDTKQTGGGVTPMIGFDIHFDKLNIGLKYEHQTIIGLKNTTKTDPTDLFTDGDLTNTDIPPIVSGGVDYKILGNLKVSASFNLYLDKMVNWGKNVYLQLRTIDKNSKELAFGLQYNLTKNFALSAGYLNSDTGVSEQYQSDFSYSNDSYTTGLGLQWNMNKRLVFDAGMMLTTYKNSTKTFIEAAPVGTYTETYGKDTFAFAFGIGYKIF